MARFLSIAVAGLVLAGILAAPARAQEGLTEEEVQKIVEDTIKKERIWDGSPKVFKELKAGGRIQFDWWSYGDANDDWEAPFDDEFNSGVEFRRARLFLSGKMWERIAFKAQYDFADASFKDVWLGTYDLAECWGCLVPDIKIGHFKEPFSLEELTSSKYLTFIERSLPNVFAPGRNSGVALHSSLMGDHITWSLGYFADGPDDDFGTNVEAFWEDGWGATARVTWLPWAPCGCEHQFLEIGGSVSYRDDISTRRYRQRPETHLAPRVVDTGTFDADSEIRYGGELAFVYDRFSLQAEYIATSVDSAAADDPTFYGYYAYASYFLGGGWRRFKRSSASFDRVKPCENFLGKDCCGWGAWEVAARYSFLDLNDGNIQGGELWDVTVGLNWYLNPNTRVMFNYIHAEGEDRRSNNIAYGEGSIDAFGIRFQVDF